MPTVSTSEARKDFADLLNRAAYAHERTEITRKGKPVAAIVPLEDLEAMIALEDAMDVRAARESLKDAEENGGTMDFDDFIESLDE
jgi:prevent-host-death family protein